MLDAFGIVMCFRRSQDFHATLAGYKITALRQRAVGGLDATEPRIRWVGNDFGASILVVVMDLRLSHSHSLWLASRSRSASAGLSAAAMRAR